MPPPFAKHITENKKATADPRDLLAEISNSRAPSLFVLLDFHHHLDDPFCVRLIKEIAQGYHGKEYHLVSVSHELNMPQELSRFTARFEMALPDQATLRKLIISELEVWKLRNTNEKLGANRKAIDLLRNNLTGLTVTEVKPLVRNTIYNDDDAISYCDYRRSAASQV